MTKHTTFKRGFYSFCGVIRIEPIRNEPVSHTLGLLCQGCSMQSELMDNSLEWEYWPIHPQLPAISIWRVPDDRTRTRTVAAKTKISSNMSYYHPISTFTQGQRSSNSFPIYFEALQTLFKWKKRPHSKVSMWPHLTTKVLLPWLSQA